MNRAIKFRAKDLLTDKRKQLKDQAWLYFSPQLGERPPVFEPNTLCEYTGLKDKNGKEIYEGDIVRNVYSKDNGFSDKYHDDNEVVSWSETQFCYEVGDFLTLGEAANDQNTSLEVIGNIYENPELLK